MLNRSLLFGALLFGVTVLCQAVEPHPKTPTAPQSTTATPVLPAAEQSADPVDPTIAEVREAQVPQLEKSTEIIPTEISPPPQTGDVEATSILPLLPEESAAAPETPAAPTRLPSAEDQASPGDLWDRIRSGFALPPLSPNNPLVAHQIEWLANRPDYVERTLTRSQPYLFFIVQEVQHRGMPTEIALLPFVESAFNPHAISRSQASGMWQFIPSTARVFGLHRDWWYDGQKDIVATTYSALDYLQRLYEEFHDWNLALASYNVGEGKIRREIAYNQAHGQPTDFEHLNLPDETRNYVPRLLAAQAIVMAPEHYGLILPPIANQPYFVSVTTHKSLDTKVAAKFCEMDESQFLMLNPGFNRPLIQIIPHQERTILVPVAVANSFVAHLDDPDAKLVSWEPRHLKRGEPLDRIAREYGMTSDELKRVNGISANKKIAGGGLILVPAGNHEDSVDVAPVDPNGRPEAEISSPTSEKRSASLRGHHGKKEDTVHSGRSHHAVRHHHGSSHTAHHHGASTSHSAHHSHKSKKSHGSN